MIFSGSHMAIIVDLQTIIIKATVEFLWVVKVNTGTVTITPVETEKLLGINIHQSLKWHEHVMSNKKSLNTKCQTFSSETNFCKCQLLFKAHGR